MFVSFEIIQVARDAFLEPLHPRLQLVRREVLVPVVDHLELSTVNRHYAFGEQPDLATQLDELPANPADRRAVVLPKVGNRLEIRHQPTGEPDQLDIALSFALQAPARLDAIEVAVDVDLEQRRRVVCRPARGCRLRPRKAQFGQIKRVDEGVNCADWIVLRNPVLKLLRKQHALRPLFPLDESAHPQLRPSRPAHSDHGRGKEFSHSLDPKRTV
jgi:hypothetical protein